MHCLGQLSQHVRYEPRRLVRRVERAVSEGEAGAPESARAVAHERTDGA
jgi:hypothetical protein